MDNLDIVLGQGTTTLELIEQVQKAGGPSLDAIVLPSATGGILSGAAVVCKGSKTMVFGCEPESGGSDLHLGLRRNILPRPSNQNSVADGLRASCSKGNFDLISQLVDGFYCVTEDQIKDAWRMTMNELRLVVEPSSAVAIATVMFNQQFRTMLASRKRHWNIGIVLTGGNTNARRIQAELGS